ncbi:uncharacterized protein LOC143154236 [Ptiloglossa arizonensis]|uniref:uncharacterized protein LOC143154236 n=1 Tax=Ptiloglossa arizonensis TaxID=3350558 RepID=UPI003FA0C68C
MSENCDVHCANGDKEFNKGIESNEIEHNNETPNCKEKLLNESLETNDPNSDVETDIFNKTLKDIDVDSAQKDNEIPNSNVLKKFSKIIDSDSEDENTLIFKTKRKKSFCSSSEDEIINSEEIIKSKKHSKKKSTKTFLNSDSDEMCGTINSDSDEKSIKSGECGEKVANIIQNRFKTLVDSESEEECGKQLSPLRDDKHKKQKEHHESKMKKISSRAAKEEAIKHIQSETQRLIRESEISLPYHKPKQRTLQEFMSRKKVLTILPKAPTMAVKLKMSSAIVDEALKEKEKEAEIFYKSSDSEEEMTTNHSSMDQENTNIEHTQKLEKDNVSRKLFVDTSLCTDKNAENSNANTMQEINETLIETKDTESHTPMTNDVRENNTNNSVSLESDCGTSNEVNENKNLNSDISTEVVEISKNKEVSDLPQKEDVENEDGEENATRSSIDKVDNDKREKLKTVDDSLDTSPLKINNDYARIVKRSLGITAEESDEYNEYGLPPPKFDDSPDINGKKTLLNVQSLKPKLRGTPGTMIDLSHDIKPNKKGINALINRFVSKHSKTDKQVKNTPDVTVTQIKESPNGLLIIKETLPYKHSNLSNEDPKLNKPGTKLIRLKEELKHKMALKRDEEWKQKEQEMKEQEIEWNESINEEDDWSESRSPNIESYKSTEDELEEDDVCEKKEKKRSKCAFIDFEAEVSDDEGNASDEFIDEDEDEDENLEEDEGECERLILEDDESNTCDSIDTCSKPKTFKRIVESVEDDSRSCNTENSEDAINKDKKISSLQTTISADMFHAGGNANEEFSGNESDIPASQMHVGADLECQASQTPQSKINSFNFVSPVTQLTALNTRLETEMEPSHEEQQLLVNESDPIFIGSTQTGESIQPIRDFKNSVMSQKKLFTDQSVLDEELMELCSGKFTQQKSDLNLSKEPDMTETQLLELCSGTFTTQENDTKNLTNDLLDESSQKQSVSKKDCTTPTVKTTAKEKQQSKTDEMYCNKLSILSSDEEDVTEKEINNRWRKKVKKLDLSEDEEDNDSLASNDEESEDEDNYIDYDSEENEIVVSKKNIKRYATKFLDKEAELSESDRDVSADEDENDLDKLELDEIDDEEIDDNEVKNKLGKLHMKHLIDKDKQEVNMLKELLFEDGDLFSESTRERKLRWKNLDKQEDNENFQASEDKDGWVDLSDEEDEAKWCKLRHEREKFLAKRMENATTEIENELNKSEIFKFGMKILKKKRINETEMQCTLLETQNSKKESRIPRTIAEMLNSSNLGDKSHTIHSVMQRRSFLARGEESLARMAAMAKQKDAPLQSINTKKFVFTYLDPSTEPKDISAVKTEAEHYKSKRKC